jgi:hypothetical protein
VSPQAPAGDRNNRVDDWRHIDNGREIPTEFYSDQPYVVQTDDGAWLCALTTGAGREGAKGQHIISVRSVDQGLSWSAPVRVESPDGPEASYAVLLKVPTGRVYCLYNYNADNVREVRGDPVTAPDLIVRRVDSLGHYVCKYSDDGGLSWSSERYDVPVREFEIDRENVYAGKLRFFWNVGRPLVRDDGAYCSLHKVGNFGDGFFIRSEGVLIKSENILTESDPTKIEWETLPHGDIGLRTPEGGGPVAEEHSYTSLSDGTIYSIYRTIDGHPTFTRSRDGGGSWDDPEYLRFADGRLVKHPRAANFLWKCRNGRYLYWFHHHGGRFIVEGKKRYGGGYPYESRNPVWLSAGEEIDTPSGRTIRWSEPEIAIYDDDPFIRMSYPDFIEEDGRVYLTETQKDVARVHEIDAEFLNAIFGQFELEATVASGCLLEWRGDPAPNGVTSIPMPELPRFAERDATRPDYGGKDNRAGVSIEVWLRIHTFAPGQSCIDWTDDSDRGVAIGTSSRKTIEIMFGDGQSRGYWDTDRGLVKENELHHIVFVFDGGPKILSVVVDGRVQDGGDSRQFGWCRLSPLLNGIEGNEHLIIKNDLVGAVHLLRIYNRALMHTECIGSYRAGPDAKLEGSSTK